MRVIEWIAEKGEESFSSQIYFTLFPDGFRILQNAAVAGGLCRQFEHMVASVNNFIVGCT